MKRRDVLVFSSGLVTGLLLSLLLYLSILAPAPAGEVPAPIPSAPSPSATHTPSPSCPEWDRAQVYNGGDKVLYEGRLYRAKWWTQGETPNGADVWEDTLEAPAPGPVNSPSPSGPVTRRDGFKVVGYYPSWVPDGVDALRLDVLTHINYAFAIPTPEGGLRPLDSPDTARTILAEAHRRDIKVLLAVGGWSYNDVPLESAFVSATETEAKRAALTNAILALCDEYGFDGVDMDWEHPRVDGPSAGQYEALMLDLAQRLHAQDKLLTAAVLSGATPDGNLYYDAAAHSDEVLSNLDWVNVMAYDGGDGERHSPYDFAVDSASYWRDTRGLAADQVVLGLPFYARPSWASYGDILSVVPDAWSSDTCDYNGMTVWYNGPDTILKKTEYALEELGGVMIWEVTQDASGNRSLQSAIADAIRNAET